MGGAREWDAGTYERVSGPQLSWGREVAARLRLRGDELVLDAGCGSGRVTEHLLERLRSAPHAGGRLIAADGSAAMIAEAASRFEGAADVELVHADLLGFSPAAPVDVVFSTATFHWITDHDALFERIFGWLAPGGRLCAQCGGAGNVEGFLALAREVAEREPYARHLRDIDRTRYFAGAEETAERLGRIGFAEVDCGLAERQARLEHPLEFLRTVCLGAHTEALPEELRERFVGDVWERFREDPVLEYVRLDIDARRPRAGAPI